jgi:hypothetical protein
MHSQAEVDLDELMQLHAETATPELRQLCWYDVQGEQDSFFTGCLDAVPELVRELRELRAVGAAAEALVKTWDTAVTAYDNTKPGQAHVLVLKDCAVKLRAVLAKVTP